MSSAQSVTFLPKSRQRLSICSAQTSEACACPAGLPAPRADCSAASLLASSASMNSISLLITSFTSYRQRPPETGAEIKGSGVAAFEAKVEGLREKVAQLFGVRHPQPLGLSKTWRPHLVEAWIEAAGDVECDAPGCRASRPARRPRARSSTGPR